MTQEEIYAENERIMAQYRPYITKKVLDRSGTSFQVARKQANREYTQRKQAEAAARKAKLAEIQARKRPRVYIKKSDAENKINTFIAQAKSNVR